MKKKYGENFVITNFSLEIKPGEVMCLLGTNGSGKTTLINMITGLQPLDDDSGDAIIILQAENRSVSLRNSLKEFRSYVRLCQ
jgi:ATP-binding cassette, subfamily C, bacterial CydC